MIYTDKISFFDITAQATNSDCEIQDFDNYIVVDNFLSDIDKFESELLKYPFDTGEELIQTRYNSGEKTNEFCKPPGHSQIVPIQLFEKYVFDAYKFLVDCEYVPQRANENLMDPEFAIKLSRNSFAYGSIFYEDMIVHKNSNAPAPAIGEYYAVLFFEDSNENGISLYDFVYDDKRHQCVDDITRLSRNSIEEISDYLNVKHSVKPDLVKYEQYLSNKHFEEIRNIPAKRNRLFITRGGNWIGNNYGNKNQSYRFTVSFTEPK